MISIVGAPHVAWTIDRVVRRASSDRHASVCTRARKYRGIYSFFFESPEHCRRIFIRGNQSISYNLTA
jgi:hypothetical protein